MGQISAFAWIIFLIVGFADYSDSGSNEFLIPQNTGCACQGSILTYTCTAVGSGNTFWTGNAFRCLSDGIILRHELYTTPGGANGQCNNGAIVGRSVGLESNCYTSQLEVNVSAIFNNKTIQCIHNSDSGPIVIGTSEIIPIVEAPSPPSNVRLSGVQQGMLTFNWTSLGSSCTSVVYDISSSCGTCPTTTNSTAVNCINLPLSTDMSTCMFSINLNICGVAGLSNIPISVTLKVPDVPRLTNIPVYAINQTLIQFSSAIAKEDSFIIAEGIFGTVMNYIISLNSLKMIKSSCGERSCKYTIDVPSSICSSSEDVNITFIAANQLGEGPPSNLSTFECTNRFVSVKHSTANFVSTIICTFLNPLDTLEKSCSANYGPCDQELTKYVIGNTTSGHGRIVLNLTLSGSTPAYCYNITASNGTYTVIVKGTIDINKSSSLASIAAPVITIILAIVVIIIISIILLLWKRKNSSYDADDVKNTKERFTDTNLRHLKLKPVDQNEWVISMHHVKSNCSLKDYINSKQELTFKRGNIYYQFSHEVETICEDENLIFMETDTGKYFSPDAQPQELHKKKLLGDRVLRPALSEYMVFIQSTGSGVRHLAATTIILFMEHRPYPLWHVDPRQFKILPIKKTCTLEVFCREHRLPFNAHKLYLEGFLSTKMIDVILMDKDTNKLLTGPDAYGMFRNHINDVEPMDEKRWRVFMMMSVYEKDLQLNKNTLILYQLQEQHQDEKPPFVRIFPEQLTSVKLDRDYRMEEFRCRHRLNHKESNVFVQADKIQHNNLKVIDVMLMKQEGEKEYFTGHSSWDEVTKCKNDRENSLWRAFSLCNFDKSLILSKNTWVLHHVYKPWLDNGLVRVHSNHLVRQTMKKGCTISEFCEQQKFGNKSGAYIFIECSTIHPRKAVKDVVLIDKTVALANQLWSYHCARDEIRKYLTDQTGAILPEILNKWRVFVLSEIDKTLEFEEDTSVLCQNSNVKSGEFYILKVDQDNIRLSEFIQNKFGSFENGKAFYEFAQTEDLLHYKEVVHVPVDRLVENKKFPSGSEPQTCMCHLSIDLFYNIPGVPGFEVKPVSLKQHKVFIQSTSQGSRNLRQDMLLLYKKY